MFRKIKSLIWNDYRFEIWRRRPAYRFDFQHRQTYKLVVYRNGGYVSQREFETFAEAMTARNEYKKRETSK